jgi:hypothetical protein
VIINAIPPTTPPIIGAIGIRDLVVVLAEPPELEPPDELEPEPPVLVAPGPAVGFVPVAAPPILVSADGVTMLYQIYV